MDVIIALITYFLEFTLGSIFDFIGDLVNSIVSNEQIMAVIVLVIIIVIMGKAKGDDKY